MRKYTTTLGVLLGALPLVFLFYFVPTTEEISFEKLEKEVLPVNVPEKVTLAFVGDIMLDRGVLLHVNKYGEGDFSYAFSKAKDRLSSYDILFGNLEGPLSDKGENRGSIFSFRMDPNSVLAIKDAGFDILSVANNHMGDWGYAAMVDTFTRLRDAKIPYSGGGWSDVEAYTPQIVEKNGMTFAFVSFSDFNAYLEAKKDRAGIAIASPDRVRAVVAEAKGKGDILIASFHFGTEYLKQPDSRQKQLAEAAIDAGADLVVGHHPHVVQPLETYKGKYIAYSLGNFIFDQYFSRATLEGGLLEVVVENKKIVSAELRRFPINRHFQPEL